MAGFELREAFRADEIDRTMPIAPQIYGLLRERIIDSRLPPGAPIHEADLAAILTISRTPLRAALQQLANEDLVETRPQVGSIVAPTNAAKVVEAVFCRGALECEVVRRLAGVPFDHRRFDAVLAAQRDAGRRDDYLAFYRVDEEFHGLLAELAGVPAAWRLVQSVKSHVDRARLNLMGTITGRSMAAYNEHLAILEAIGQGDGERAAQLMHDHVTTVFDALHGGGAIPGDPGELELPATSPL